jgi:hypothetical protein
MPASMAAALAAALFCAVQATALRQGVVQPDASGVSGSGAARALQQGGVPEERGINIQFYFEPDSRRTDDVQKYLEQELMPGAASFLARSIRV